MLILSPQDEETISQICRNCNNGNAEDNLRKATGDKFVDKKQDNNGYDHESGDF